MKVIVSEPQKLCEVREIGSSLKDYQDIVGGYNETVYPFDDNTVLVCNEEGKLHNLPWNRPLIEYDGRIYDIVCGTFFICGVDNEEGDFISLTDEQIKRYTEYYNEYMWHQFAQFTSTIMERFHYILGGIFMKDYCEARRFRSFSAWLGVNLARNNMIQKDIATVMGVTPSWISQCIRGYVPVRLKTVEKFCYGFGHPEDSYNVWVNLC